MILFIGLMIAIVCVGLSLLCASADLEGWAVTFMTVGLVALSLQCIVWAVWIIKAVWMAI